MVSLRFIATYSRLLRDITACTSGFGSLALSLITKITPVNLSIMLLLLLSTSVPGLWDEKQKYARC